MEIKLPETESKVLEVRAERNASELHLSLVGAADLRVENYFETVLNAVHDYAKQPMISSVTVDLRELTFINSSCLKSFVVWISNVRQLGDAAYKIVFLQKKSVSWQERSLNSLKAFGEEIVTVK